MMKKKSYISGYLIDFLWDEEASVWTATGKDVPGLVLESESYDELADRVEKAIPELIELNGGNAEQHSNKRSFGALANDEFYIAPDFDTCFDDAWDGGLTMKQFSIPLNNDDPRPTVHLENNIDAMFATGMVFPIWISSEEELRATGAKLIRDNLKTDTTYGEAIGKLYEIHDFKLGELSYPILHVICAPSDFAPCRMMLGTVMFEGLIVTVDRAKNELIIRVPDSESSVRNVVIEETNGLIEVVCQSVE